MLLYPMAFDQFGLAARAKYHGVGMVSDIRELDVAALQAQIKAVLTTPSFSIQARRMRQLFLLADKHESASRKIEVFLQDGVDASAW